jgi:hypothetical protein
MPEKKDIIYDSPQLEPDDEFWLEHGKKMLEESIGSVRDAAKSMMTGLGLLKGIYLGILGFADYIPKTMPIYLKSLFIIPLIFWLVALYHCMQVLMTKRLYINIHSPDDIRQKSENVLLEKQASLHWAYGSLSLGIIAALLLLIFRTSS